MPYSQAYQLQFLNREESLVVANIYDTESAEGTTVFTQLTGADDPLHLFVVDNEESKFTPIRAKQAEIKFISTQDVNLTSFISGNDNRWQVDVLVNNQVQFRGFLVLDDMDEDFLAPERANVVTLIATDGLGLLKDIPLTTADRTYSYTRTIDTGTLFTRGSLTFSATGVDAAFFVAGATLTITNAGSASGVHIIVSAAVVSGNIIVLVATPFPFESHANATLAVLVAGINPRGYWSIREYVAWALQKTGLRLNINVVHNVHEENNPGYIIYERLYLQAKTFEAEINESIDCYDVLERILGQDCFLTQSGGEWWIVRVDDVQDNATWVNSYDPDGGYILLSRRPFDTTKTFDPVTEMLFSGMATFTKVQRAAKRVRLTYNYEYPKEVVDNTDFSQGAERTDVDPINPVQNVANFGALPVAGSVATFYRTLNNGALFIWRNNQYKQITARTYAVDYWTTRRYQLNNLETGVSTLR